MTATLSPCGTYRYTLSRRVFDWTLQGRRACIIMVNPSTADAENDDATIRKLIGFAQRCHWMEFTVVNLFAYRATDVRELADAADPIGPMNDHHILCAMAQADIIVVAWGASAKLPPRLRDRWRVIVHLADGLGKFLDCWGTCDDGHPRHPVMLGYDNLIRQWSPPHA